MKIASMSARLRATALAVVIMLAAAPATAAEGTPPDVLVRETTEQVLDILQTNRQRLEEHPELIYETVSELVLPHFDFRLMSRFVLARNWQKASEEQQARFVDAFRELIVRTYGSALAEYSGQTVEYLPVQIDPERDRVTVGTRIRQDAGPSIPLDYSLYRRDGVWKVFDVSVDGVSLVQNYRSSFASEVSRNGIDGLISQLENRNAGDGGDG